MDTFFYTMDNAHKLIYFFPPSLINFKLLILMENTIGFYDSGSGGLNILKKTIAQINNLNYIYVADNLNLPYGNKSDNFILNRSVEIVVFFN